MDVEIFEVEGGFGYRVDSVVQYFHPEKPGFEPMTKDEAEQFASEVAARM